VEFAAPVNELVLPAEALELPLRNADATLAAYLEGIAGELIAALPPEDALLERLRRAIVELLPEGPPTLERTSRRLGVGGRTLQRRLVERGLKYHDLVDEVRQASAERLLSRAELSVAQVAFLVGFSDPSGFRRAHRRWTRRAPRRN
jgi:AraC-like DNA-binding protein